MGMLEAPTTPSFHRPPLVQAREMTSVELLLDVLRMAQLAEDELRKSDRAALEAAVRGFQQRLRAGANDELPPSAAQRTQPAPAGEAVAGEAAGAARAAAGWRALPVGEWAAVRVSQLLREGGGDGSDFALVLCALMHSLGVRTRLAIICLPRGVDPVPLPGGEGSERRCRLVAEARTGMHPSTAAQWVAQRHAAGPGALGAPTPRVHFRREADGAVWLSFGWHPPAGSHGDTHGSGPSIEGEPLPGAAYLHAEIDGAQAEWTTFYPFDEHGCKWHVSGTEADSAGRAHSSAPASALRVTDLR